MNKTLQTAAGVSVLVLGVAWSAAADQCTSAAGCDKSYTGKVVSVDSQNRVLEVQSWPLSKKDFDVGQNCTFTMLATNNATLADLRPGQSVTISYQSSHGVRVAGHIRQNSMRVEGVVAAINPNTGEVTLKRHGLEMSKTLRIAGNCQVALNGNRGGKLVDIHPGDTVAITYETPNGLPTAEQISVTSAAFVGTLTEIEPSEHIVKAEAGSVTKEFALGEHCTIVVNGKPDGTLSQLAPNERVVLDYQPVNGVNIVDWIGPAPAASQTKLRSAASSSHSSYPMSYPTGY